MMEAIQGLHKMNPPISIVGKEIIIKGKNTTKTYTITGKVDEKFKTELLELLNSVYQYGFSDCASELLNKK